MSSPPADPARAATLDELRRVIRRIETARAHRPVAVPVEAVVGGQELETEQGRLLVVRREYPLSHRHGRLSLAAAARVGRPALDLITVPPDDPPDPRGLLFLDAETTGLAGGTGTYAFLVGAGWREDDRFVVTQYFMRDLDEEPALLAVLAPLLARATGLVTFNGGGFDLPLLETRFVLARRRWPGAVPHLDLLRPARRVWAPWLPDCRLGTLERQVLGLARTEDVPGALIPARYFDYLRSRRAAPLAGVFAHNRDDVLSLAALLGWFGLALDGPGPPGLEARELAGLGRLWERLDTERAAACYREALAGGLGGPPAHRLRLRLAAWEKRQRRWAQACDLWQAAAAVPSFDPRPWEELAKYHEHRRRDVPAARAIVLEALALARAAAAPAGILRAFDHRLARLDRRLGRGGGGRSGREGHHVQHVGLGAHPGPGEEGGRRGL